MKHIKILELEHLNDLFKLILDGEPIEIYFLGFPDNDEWWKDRINLALDFFHWTENYRVHYEGVIDKSSKKIIKLKINNLIEIEEEHK